MSPRKGGSSHHSSSGGGSGSSSSGGSTFSNYYDNCFDLSSDGGGVIIATFTIQALCFIILVFTTLLWVFFSLYKRSTEPSPVQRVLRFYSYGPLLLFFLVSIVLIIIQVALDICFIIGPTTSDGLAVAFDLFGGIVEIILLPLISIVFVRYLLGTKARSTGLATIVNAAIFGLIVALWVPVYALWSYILDREDYDTDTAISTYKLTAAYYFLYFIAAIVASVFVLSAVIPSSVPSFGIACKIFSLFTLLMFCTYPLVSGIRAAAYEATGKVLSDGANIAFQIFTNFPLVLAVLGLLLAVHTAKPRGGTQAPSNAVGPVGPTGKQYAYEQPPSTTSHTSSLPGYQQPPQHQTVPAGQPIYPNQGVYNHGGVAGSSGMVFYKPPNAA